MPSSELMLAFVEKDRVPAFYQQSLALEVEECEATHDKYYLAW